MYTYRVEQAIRAATILHKEQSRKGKLPLPYITHVLAVALIVGDYTDDEDVFIAALLHDTLEDTDYTALELQEDFGGKVRQYVEFLTQPKKVDVSEMSWKDRKTMYAKQLKDAPEEALLVVAADKIHNMRSMVEDYYEDHKGFLQTYPSNLNDRVMVYQDISNTLNTKLKSDIITEFNQVFTEYKNFLTDVKKTQDASKT